MGSILGEKDQRRTRVGEWPTDGRTSRSRSCVWNKHFRFPPLYVYERMLQDNLRLACTGRGPVPNTPIRGLGWLLAPARDKDYDKKDADLMNRPLGRICVFCGSSSGRSPKFVETAREVGRELGARDLTLVYGAGPAGMMGAVAEATWESGGQAIGVIPRLVAQKEAGRSDKIDLRLVDSMHERKAVMAELSDGFIVLPGGIGTYDELFEVLTWSQLQFHDKPIVIVNVVGHFDRFLALLDHIVESGFLAPAHRALAHVVSTVSEAFELIYGTEFTRRAPDAA
jgi:uncharacterized protein (TIGR00730 family)